jgi:DNA repair protein RecO (recombination protein O)
MASTNRQRTREYACYNADMPSRERSFRAEAVVLRHQDWGEADRLLVLFTLEMGKVRAIGKGVRKPRSRKAGHLEPFSRVHLLLARGRDLLIVTQAEMIEAYLPLRENLLLPTYANYVVELLDRFSFEEGENRALYRLLVETLERLSSDFDPDLVVRYYEMRLLDLTGFRPELFHCVSCGEEIQPQDQYFSAEHGGVLCPKCGKGVQGARPVSMDALRYLRHFQRSTFTEAARAHLNPLLKREVEDLMQHYLTYLLERALNTPAFLRRVRADTVEVSEEETDQAD